MPDYKVVAIGSGLGAWEEWPLEHGGAQIRWGSFGHHTPQHEPEAAEAAATLFSMLNTSAIEQLVDSLVQEHSRLRHSEAASRHEVEQLGSQLVELVGRVKSLEAANPQAIALRDIDRTQAKKEILEYFLAEKEQRYPSDAAVALRLDAAVVRDICDELVSEGKLAP